MTRQRRLYVAEFVVVFLAVAILIWPLFKLKYLDLWSSIESTFIADARFLSDNWVHPDWQPNWYCGTRTDYVYPPAIRYGTAAITKAVPKVVPARAYHLYIAFFYCFGIAAVFLFVRYASRSRMAAAVAAAATALVSPSYLFNPVIRGDAPYHLPYRLHVLMSYGEGPHMTALAWIPMALLFSFRALQSWRPASLAAAGLCCAMVVSNNFYGATALAMLFPALVWAIYITHLDRWIWLRGAMIACLAYGWTAFWLIPSYLEITLFNMRYVSSAGKAWSVWLAVFVALGIVAVSYRFVRGKRQLAYTVFVCGALAIFVTNVLGHYYLNFRIIGEPGRLYPELDFLLILAGVELLRRFWAGQAWRKTVAALIVLAALLPSVPYLRNSRVLFIRDPDPTDQVEYQMQDWMHRNMPQSRAFVTGSVRFWYNVWHDLPQVGGGSEQGLLNPTVMPAQWEVRIGEDVTLALWWLQLLGADAILVHEANSRELFHDYHHPAKFRPALPALYDDKAGNFIYRVPRRYPSLARVVDRARFDGLPDIPGNGDQPSLAAWVDVVERGPEAPTETRWLGTDELRISANVQEGESVFVQVSFDPNWRAVVDGKPVPVRRNKLGFITIDPPAGAKEIQLQFPTPLANQVGRVVTALTLAVSGGLLVLSRRRRKLM